MGVVRPFVRSFVRPFVRSLVRSLAFFRNFERPFTRRTWLRSARNFGKTRFRRFATFDFLTSNFFWKTFFGGRFFFPRRQVRLEKLLPVVRLFLGRLPWRRGKRLN